MLQKPGYANRPLDLTGRFIDGVPASANRPGEAAHKLARSAVREESMRDEDVISMLTAGGVAIDAWFIVGNMPAHPSGIGLYEALLIEDGAVAAACLAFLRRRGVKEFSSVEEVVRAGVASERWL